MSALTKHLKVSVEYIGLERQPVMIIDDFVQDPRALVFEARARQYGVMGPYYPGIRAPVSPGLIDTFVPSIINMAAEIFALKGRIRLIEALYSLVTTPPSELKPIQRLPHFDGLEPERIAILHYLCPPECGGTAFYRHKSTGIESLSTERMAEYSRKLDEDVSREGLPGAAYISGSTSIFEQTARFTARYNRALIYRGSILHCADPAVDARLAVTPDVGRLTVNTFLMGDPKSNVRT